MKSIEIELGPVVVNITDKRVVVARRGGRGYVHFTAYFAPQSEGRRAGRWTPHISTRRGKEWLAAVPTRVLHRFAAHVESDLGARWIAATRRVDLQVLSRQGWIVHSPTDAGALMEMLERHLLNSRGRYSLDDRRVEALLDEMWDRLVDECVDPLALSDSFQSGRPYYAIQPHEDGSLDACWLSPPDERCDAWQATPDGWLPKHYMRDLLVRETAGQLEAALARISDALGLKWQPSLRA